MYLQAGKIRIPEFKDDIDDALFRLIERHDEHILKQQDYDARGGQIFRDSLNLFRLRLEYAEPD